MKKITIIALVLIIISCSSKQKFISEQNQEPINYIPYYLKVYEADSLFTLKDYQGSCKILDDLFKKYEAKNTVSFYEYGTYLASCLMTGNTENIDIKVKKSYRDFGVLVVLGLDSQKHIDDLIKLSKITTSEIEELKKEYLNSLNQPLISKLTQMLNEDQSVRIDYSKDGMVFYEKKHKKELDSIFLSSGYPSVKELGQDIFFDMNNIKSTIPHFEAIIIHISKEANKEGFEELNNKLNPYLKNGTCAPHDYATYYDSNLWVTKNQQKYGTIGGQDIEKTLPLLNPKKIDSIRKSVGLPSKNYLIWRDKINYGD
jgi:hypothetical protein